MGTNDLCYRRLLFRLCNAKQTRMVQNIRKLGVRLIMTHHVGTQYLAAAACARSVTAQGQVGMNSEMRRNEEWMVIDDGRSRRREVRTR